MHLGAQLKPFYKFYY